MIEIQLGYIVACAIIAFLGRYHSFGMIGWFFLSFFLSPVFAGMIMVICWLFDKEDFEEHKDTKEI